MKSFLFSVMDSAVQGFDRPFIAPTEQAAIRAVKDAVNNAESPLSSHPEDYVLYELGVFDADNGVITPNVEGPRMVARCKDLVQKVN